MSIVQYRWKPSCHDPDTLTLALTGVQCASCRPCRSRCAGSDFLATPRRRRERSAAAGSCRHHVRPSALAAAAQGTSRASGHARRRARRGRRRRCAVVSVSFHKLSSLLPRGLSLIRLMRGFGGFARATSPFASMYPASVQTTWVHGSLRGQPVGPLSSERWDRGSRG